MCEAFLETYFTGKMWTIWSQIYETIDETLMKVLAGGFSFISFKNYVTVAVASKFAGTVESSPFYVSKQGVSIMAVFGWHTR